jgi:hypothetical protein
MSDRLRLHLDPQLHAEHWLSAVRLLLGPVQPLDHRPMGRPQRAIHEQSAPDLQLRGAVRLRLQLAGVGAAEVQPNLQKLLWRSQVWVSVTETVTVVGQRQRR